MRVHAIDLTASAGLFSHHAVTQIRMDTLPGDIVITFRDKVNEVKRADQLDELNMDADDWGDYLVAMQWFEARYLRPEDELIIYTDDFPSFLWSMEPTLYKLKFVLTRKYYQHESEGLERAWFKVDLCKSIFG